MRGNGPPRMRASCNRAFVAGVGKPSSEELRLSRASEAAGRCPMGCSHGRPWRSTQLEGEEEAVASSATSSFSLTAEKGARGHAAAHAPYITPLSHWCGATLPWEGREACNSAGELAGQLAVEARRTQRWSLSFNLHAISTAFGCKQGLQSPPTPSSSAMTIRNSSPRPPREPKPRQKQARSSAC